MEEPTIPFVIDNQQHTMDAVLNMLLAEPDVRSLDIATAYFNVGWECLHANLQRLASKTRRGSVRLLLGDEPEEGEDLGLRKLKTINYNLEATYQGIYENVVSLIESLRLAPYRLEHYKQQGEKRDVFEEGREEALAGIFKSRYLKRFESSIEAFRISVRRALEFLQTCETFLDAGKMLNSADFQKALRYLASEDEEDDATVGNGSSRQGRNGGADTLAGQDEIIAPSLFDPLPSSRAGELAASEEAQAFVETLPALDATLYDLAHVRRDIRLDIAALRTIWQQIAAITPQQDTKLARLKELLAGDLRGKKVLIIRHGSKPCIYHFRDFKFFLISDSQIVVSFNKIRCNLYSFTKELDCLIMLADRKSVV